MKKSFSILGSTGSIGTTTLKIIEKKKIFKLNILFANKNLNLIVKQIKKYKPETFIIGDYQVFKKVKKIKNQKTQIIYSKYLDYKTLKKSDITLSAISGIEGLKPTIEFIKKSKKILIANKEAIICGWDLIKKESQINKTKIVPMTLSTFQ